MSGGTDALFGATDEHALLSRPCILPRALPHIVSSPSPVCACSDGLWDVMDSNEVVKLARRDLQRGSTPQVRARGRPLAAPPARLHAWAAHAALLTLRHGWRLRARRPCTQHASPTPTPSAAAQEVAERLSALAVKRGSQDNVAVVLMDLGKVDWGSGVGANGGGGLFGGLGSLFGSR